MSLVPFSPGTPIDPYLIGVRLGRYAAKQGISYAARKINERRAKRAAERRTSPPMAPRNIFNVPPPETNQMRDGIRSIKQIEMYERYGLTSRTSTTRTRATDITVNNVFAPANVGQTDHNNLRCLSPTTSSSPNDRFNLIVSNVLTRIPKGVGENDRSKCEIDIKNLKVKYEFFNRHPQQFYLRIMMLAMKAPYDNEAHAQSQTPAQYCMENFFEHPDDGCHVCNVHDDYWYNVDTHHHARLYAKVNRQKFKVLHNTIKKLDVPAYDLTHTTSTLQDGPDHDKTIFRARRFHNHITSHTINTGPFSIAWKTDTNESFYGVNSTTPNLWFVVFAVDASRDRFMSNAQDLPIDYMVNYNIEFKDIL